MDSGNKRTVIRTFLNKKKRKKKQGNNNNNNKKDS